MIIQYDFYLNLGLVKLEYLRGVRGLLPFWCLFAPVPDRGDASINDKDTTSRLVS
jgi:hypothetical protein